MPRVRLRRLAALILCAYALSPAADTRADAPDPYYRLIYDYEVAGFCGLVKRDVHDAYHARRAALEAASGLSENETTKIRVAAMADAEREYINRGLGGHKPWCRTDGARGVARILGSD